MNRRFSLVGGAVLLATIALTQPTYASSHREALAVLNEPCADNTDVYAWVSPGAHDKLYLIGNFLPLHEPGQGNQGLRVCEGYRYEFHVGVGKKLDDKVIYRVEFHRSPLVDGAPGPNDPVGGGNELLYQLTGSVETYDVYRIRNGYRSVLAKNVPVAPNDHGPQTDRLVYGLGDFQGYDSGDPTSREDDLYDDEFAAGFVNDLTNGGRAFAGQRDDPFYLDEKGIFDLVNLSRDGLFGIEGARNTPGEDVFAGFNVFTLALELPTSDVFPQGIPHNGELRPTSTDSLMRVWFSISKPERQIVSRNAPGGYVYQGEYKQVGREALPLFNAGLVGTSRHTLYLRSDPRKDVTNFGKDILFPVLVRDADALGLYAALGIPPETVATLKGPRLDIINAINLGRPIPVLDGYTGDVITLDAAIDSQFPNGRRLDGGPAPNQEHVDVSDALIGLIVAGDPGIGAGDGVNGNDKDYLTEFPFVAAPHSGLNGGHGAPAD